MIKTLLKLLAPGFFMRSHVAAATIGAAAVGAVGSGIASSNAAGAQKSAAEAANSPWSAAQPYISGQFDGAQTALQNALGMGTYSGERVAGLNPYQTQGANQTAAYANGNGQNTANQFYNTGMGLTNTGASYGTNAQGLLSQAQQDPTQGFMNYANSLANSSMADNLITAANRDASRSLNESQLPSLAVQAAGNGNTDSTRTGVTQAILQRNASEQMADTAAQIRNSLFNTGLQTAQSQYNSNADRALTANNQIGQAYQLGSSALLNGQQANGNNFDQLNAAGGLFQAQQQNVDNAAMQQFNEQQSTPLNLYGQYMNVINGKWGGQPVSSVGPSVVGSALQGGTSGALTGAGISQMLGGYNNNSMNFNNSGFTMPGGNDYTNTATTAMDAYQAPAGLSAFGYGS
ncbi:hypothetical protein AWB76_07210 [Caballeronia temeraria]|uniref:Uncharacterized protein n=1 Tax=Caballeronia temeraria TaxID=1777137 RepID=A0A158DMN4_9BURK|nr:hypothetical protein [Caballeronia temeraria]SAK95869.1 hypothetical protein AWB76_07210 [Caballeronia temeraria]